MFGSEVLCLQSVSSFRKPRDEQVSLIKVADTQHGAHCVSGSCTKYLRESNHLQPRDNLRKGALSLIPFYRWGYKHRQGFRRLPRDTGQGAHVRGGAALSPVAELQRTCPEPHLSRGPACAGETAPAHSIRFKTRKLLSASPLQMLKAQHRQ